MGIWTILTAFIAVISLLFILKFWMRSPKGKVQIFLIAPSKKLDDQILEFYLKQRTDVDVIKFDGFDSCKKYLYLSPDLIVLDQFFSSEKVKYSEFKEFGEYVKEMDESIKMLDLEVTLASKITSSDFRVRDKNFFKKLNKCLNDIFAEIRENSQKVKESRSDFSKVPVSISYR